MRIYIAIPVRDRMAIAAQCVPTVRSGAPDDALIIYNDGSTEPLPEEVRKAATGIVETRPGIGIEAQRRKHFAEFWGNREIHGCSHLYLTDADSPHDPNWRQHALELQQISNRPVCLYDTDAHVALKCVVEDDARKPYIIRRVAPGVSYLLTMEHVEKVVSYLDRITNWDWQVPAILGGQMCVARKSHCSHIGWKGLHHKDEYGIDGGDMPRNPTDWLVAKRSEILDTLRRTAPHA